MNMLCKNFNTRWIKKTKGGSLVSKVLSTFYVEFCNIYIYILLYYIYCILCIIYRILYMIYDMYLCTNILAGRFAVLRGTSGSGAWLGHIKNTRNIEGLGVSRFPRPPRGLNIREKTRFCSRKSQQRENTRF